MEKKHKSFVVFLDVDGVLNSSTTVQKTPAGYKGIDNERVEVLAKTLQKYGEGEVVLSSDWKEMAEEDDDFQYLLSKLGKYGLALSGKTEDHFNKRGEGIMNYLKEHPEIEEYVILDDNEFDFREYKEIWEHFLITKDGRRKGIEHAQAASETPTVEAMIFLDYIKMF